MRLVVRNGEDLRFHQKWKTRAAFAIGGVMLAGLAIATVYENIDGTYDISGAVGMARSYDVPKQPKDNLVRRLLSITTTAKPSSVQIYPNDYIIGKYNKAGDEDWDNGSYGDAPAGRKVGIIVHIIGVIYMLVGLNTVCDIYFCGALDEMVEKWKVKPDVAGATFMAAGGSAPELFTSLIGAVITENDVGFGTIVGSAVFNVLAVIGCCGIVAKEPIPLTWWPLFRDCSFYIFGLCMLAIFAYGESIEMPDGKKIGGGKIELYEAILLFCFYLVYITIMFFNEKLERTIQGFLDRVKGRVGGDASASKVAPIPAGETEDTKAADLRGGAQASEPAPGPPQHHVGISGGEEQAPQEDTKAPQVIGASGEGGQKCEKTKHDHSLDHHLRRVHHKSHMAHHHEHHAEQHIKHAAVVAEGSVVKVQGAEATPAADKADAENAPLASAAPKDADAESDCSDDDVLALITKPEDTKDAICWALCLPIYAGLYYTIPRPSPKWFMATFCISLLWIAGFSFWLVYFVDMFGVAIFGGGDNVTIVMSFTLLAAGTSIPDLVSSMAVAKAGEGDMAVSSSIGSNIFDILVGLPIPWILKIGVVEMGVNGNSDYTVAIKSPYIALYVFLLLFMVAMVIISIHSIGWKLNKPLGIGMAVLYVMFLCIVLPIEIVNKGPYI